MFLRCWQLHIPPDDESRFLTLHVDDSPYKSRAIVLARAKGPK